MTEACILYYTIVSCGLFRCCFLNDEILDLPHACQANLILEQTPIDQVEQHL